MYLSFQRCYVFADCFAPCGIFIAFSETTTTKSIRARCKVLMSPGEHGLEKEPTTRLQRQISHDHSTYCAKLSHIQLCKFILSVRRPQVAPIPRVWPQENTADAQSGRKLLISFHPLVPPQHHAPTPVSAKQHFQDSTVL